MNIALQGEGGSVAEVVCETLLNAGHAVERCLDGMDSDAPLDAFIAVIDDAPAKAFLEGDEDVFYGALERAYYATMRACRSALLRIDEGGSMIFIVSARARLGAAGYTAACAAAGGVYMQARSYALTSARVGVRSNGVVLYNGWHAASLNNVIAYLLSPASGYMSGGYIALGDASVVCNQPAFMR